LLFLLLCSPHPAAGGERLRLATTTSTENSGLLVRLLPPFTERSGITVDVIAVGSGKAIKLGENGDVDAVLSHAPKLEEKFVKDGFGVNRRSVMYNDFVLIGPPGDPADVGSALSAAEAFRRIADNTATFVSRGDESGTHQKEKILWQLAGRQPVPPWYLSAGLGMGKVLLMADERRAYTLTDRGTFVAYRSRGDSVIVFEGDPPLRNPYTIIAVNPARHPSVNFSAATQLIGWLTSPAGQQLLATYTVDGEVLFHPMASNGEMAE
jgi:tungstate transport system substrate-binding protein